MPSGNTLHNASDTFFDVANDWGMSPSHNVRAAGDSTGAGRGRLGVLDDTGTINEDGFLTVLSRETVSSPRISTPCAPQHPSGSRNERKSAFRDSNSALHCASVSPGFLFR